MVRSGAIRGRWGRVAMVWVGAGGFAGLFGVVSGSGVFSGVKGRTTSSSGGNWAGDKGNRVGVGFSAVDEGGGVRTRNGVFRPLLLLSDSVDSVLGVELPLAGFEILNSLVLASRRDDLR